MLILVCAFSFYKAEEIYGFIGLCQSDSNYHEIPNEICFFICRFVSCALEKCCLCHHFLLQCVLLVYGRSLPASLSSSAFYLRKLRKVLNDLNQMESSNYCEGPCTRDVSVYGTPAHYTSNYDGYAKCKWMSYINKFPKLYTLRIVSFLFRFAFSAFDKSFITFWYSEPTTLVSYIEFIFTFALKNFKSVCWLSWIRWTQ